MANEEHLKRLLEGVDAWNAWRDAQREIQPDLSRANLSHADLSNFNLFRADLTYANLRATNLQATNLLHAQLTRADLTRANLVGSDLSYANLIDGDLTSANLTSANLTCARMGYTILASLDLSQVQGLETISHNRPSNIGIDTIYRSQGKIPLEFLRGAGVPENFIKYMHLLTEQAFQYPSCFISYSSKDQAFAERLHADLQDKGVRCWFAPEDLKIGDKFWDRIDESIRLHDKLLVILSEHSVESAWVEDEVMRALEKEHQQPGHTVLFPIRLRDAVEKTNHPWASSIRMKRHIGDFSHWKDHDAYQNALERLLRDLKAASPPT